VVDFFSASCHNLTTLQLFDVKEIHMDDLRYFCCTFGAKIKLLVYIGIGTGIGIM
jgi:hypothetical protein